LKRSKEGRGSVEVVLMLAKPGLEAFRLKLVLDDTPLASKVIQALRTERKAIHAMWSGNAICAHLGPEFETPRGGNREETAEFGLGEVAFSPVFNELVLAHGKVLFYNDRTEMESLCFPIGKVGDEDLEKLEELGRSTSEEGARTVTMA
jgi:hypothetical protein